MSSRYINAELRELVAVRAGFICEYCLISEEDTYFGCQIEHIISLKHGGPSEAENLAYSCVFCNRYKGSDVASVSIETGELARFYNPRTDRWPEHFVIEETFIKALTPIGKVTSRILQFNNEERLLERRVLQRRGRYPSAAALLLIRTK
jgi:HNH endonuclease